MTGSYSSLCDDFYVDMYVNTELDLPTQRETILTFFERIQKQFPSMCSFYRRSPEEYSLEEDRSTGSCRWVSLEVDRIGSGVVNPARFEDAYSQNRLVLELMPYMLSVSHLDVNSLDVTFMMDFDCPENQEVIIGEALLAGSAFSRLWDFPGGRPIELRPSVVVALTADNQTQLRLTVGSKRDSGEAARGKGGTEGAITLSVTIRRFPSGRGRFEPAGSFEQQCRLAEEIMAEKIVPHFVHPLINVITEKRFT